MLNLIGLISFVYTIISRTFNNRTYLRLFKFLIKDDDKVIDIINKSKDKLEEHLIKSLEKPQLLNVKVFDFSSCYRIYENILYLEEIINRKFFEDNKFKVKYLSKLNLGFTIIFFLLFIILFFVK